MFVNSGNLEEASLEMEVDTERIAKVPQTELVKSDLKLIRLAAPWQELLGIYIGPDLHKK